MLILSRRLGERIAIGPDIFLTVVEIERGRVRLGFEAPRHVPIMRTELMDDDGAYIEMDAKPDPRD